CIDAYVPKHGGTGIGSPKNTPNEERGKGLERKRPMITALRCRRTALASVLVLALGAASAVAAAPASQPSVPVSGTAPGGGTLSGVFTLTSFALQNGQIVAQGTLSGIMTTATGATSILTTVA